MIMIEASFTGFIRTVAIIILSYYALRFLLRIFAPVIVQQVVKKAEQNMYQQQEQYRQQHYTRQKQDERAQPTEKKKVGEYIDFEEID